MKLSLILLSLLLSTQVLAGRGSGRASGAMKQNNSVQHSVNRTQTSAQGQTSITNKRTGKSLNSQSEVHLQKGGLAGSGSVSTSAGRGASANGVYNPKTHTGSANVTTNSGHSATVEVEQGEGTVTTDSGKTKSFSVDP